MIIVEAVKGEANVKLYFKSAKIAKFVRDTLKTQGWEAEAQSVKILD